MAGLMETEEPRGGGAKRIGLIVAALLVLMGGAVAVFYHHANHAEAEGEAIRVLTLPIHTKFAHVENTVGADQEEDSLYLVTQIRIKDRTYAPLFIKDIHERFVAEDGSTIEGDRIRMQDYERLFGLQPRVKPLTEQAGGKALSLEQKVPRDSTAEGYVIFQHTVPQSVWEKRKSAEVVVEFYHQNPAIIPIPQ